MPLVKKGYFFVAVIFLFLLMAVGANAAEIDEITTAPAIEQPAEPEEVEPGTTEPEATEPPAGAEAESVSAYRIAEDSAFSLTAGDTDVALYEKEYFIDANDDGKYSTADSRVLLRISIGLEDMPADVRPLDFNEDGSLTTQDARLSLRYNLSLAVYYCDADGAVYPGFFQFAEGGRGWFDAAGGLMRGYGKIEEDYYYFNADGVMQTGFATVLGATAYFDEDGKAVNGLMELDGTRYYFQNGLAQTGFQTIDGKRYYFNKDGSMATGTVSIDGETYYLGTDGVLRDGKYTENGETYYYDKGALYTGWIFEGLNAYYYSNGKMLRSTTSGSYSFDSSGIASASSITTDTLPVYLRGILKRIGTSPYDIYSYVHNNFRYKYYDKASPEAMAVRILSSGRGACYDYAYLTKFLLEAAGYEAIVVVGGSFNAANGNEHDWVLYNANGVWRYMDTQRGVYSKTASELRALGYRWSENGLPAAN